MSHPRPGPPGPPPHASAPRGSPAPRRPHHVSGCPSPAPGKDLVSPFPGRCNCKPPGARGLYLSRNACPRGRRERSICLPPAKKFFFLPPFARGIPNFNFLFLSSGPRQLESTNSRRGPYCCFFFESLLSWGFCGSVQVVPALASRVLQPLPASLVPPVRCGAGHGSSEPLLSCGGSCKKSSWRGSGWWGVGR